MGCNILLLIWSVKASAYKNNFLNKLEMNTEMFIAIITFHLLTFTDFVPEIQTRVLMGYSFIFWVLMLVVINLYFVFKEMGKVFMYKMIKRYRLFLMKYRPEAFREHQLKRNEEFKDQLRESHLERIKTLKKNSLKSPDKKKKESKSMKDKRKMFAMKKATTL